MRPPAEGVGRAKRSVPVSLLSGDHWNSIRCVVSGADRPRSASCPLLRTQRMNELCDQTLGARTSPCLAGLQRIWSTCFRQSSMSRTARFQNRHCQTPYSRRVACDVPVDHARIPEERLRFSTIQRSELSASPSARCDGHVASLLCPSCELKRGVAHAALSGSSAKSVDGLFLARFAQWKPSMDHCGWRATPASDFSGAACFPMFSPRHRERHGSGRQ